jgi:hypothetical protein
MLEARRRDGKSIAERLATVSRSGSPTWRSGRPARAAVTASSEPVSLVWRGRLPEAITRPLATANALITGTVRGPASVLTAGRISAASMGGVVAGGVGNYPLAAEGASSRIENLSHRIGAHPEGLQPAASPVRVPLAVMIKGQKIPSSQCKLSPMVARRFHASKSPALAPRAPQPA